MVYVLDINGQPLMPTNRHGKVKHLLKQGKAKVVKRCPFTIKLLYDSTNYTQNLTLGVDTGSGTIGTAVSDKKGNMNGMIKIVIYKHTCIVNNKSYIGYTTKTMDERWREHVKSSKYGSKFHFHNAIRKYGENNFIHEILFNGYVKNLGEAHLLEQKYIKKYDTYNKGYNSTKGGEGCLGLIVSEETKKKLSIIAKKENLSEEKLSKMRNAKLGKKLSKETKEKLSKSHKGKQFSDQHKENLAKSKREYYKNKDNRIKDADYHSKKYRLINNNLSVDIIITNLKQYCIDNNLNYKRIQKTAKRGTCTRDGWLAILI